MLYVFHVDAGQMTTYDMNLTLQSVESLKAAIERKTKIPASSLVLLVSGGDVLQSDHMVSSYGAGTDTNPIYMFSKPSVRETHLKQSMCGDLSPIVELIPTVEYRDARSHDAGISVAELRAGVERCCSLPAAVSTVVTCAALAQQFSELAHDVTRSCEQLVLEQYQQHQGWATVVANLEDIFTEFCERSKGFKESFRKHRLKREEYTQQLGTLEDVLESLGKIPILPALQMIAEAHRFSAFDVFEGEDFDAQLYKHSRHSEHSSEHSKPSQDFGVEQLKFSKEEEVFQGQASTSKDVTCSVEAEARGSGAGSERRVSSTHEDPTLLVWITAQGNKASLQDILDYCTKGLALLDEEPLKNQEEELCRILEYANTQGLKQIKGIEDRLHGLDQLLNDAKKVERDQHDQAASLISCRERISSVCDPSVLPTLVQSHCCQLEKLLKGHQYLVDVRRRITKSKDELSQVLKARLEAVLVIENSMSVQDAHSMLSFQCFNRLERYFDIVSQLHRAPAVFVRAVHECARRQAFSHAHLKWATDLAAKLLKIHEEEVARRQEFNAQFEGHFLKSLFPGMSELPPTFATQAPPVFDAKLPKLTEIDVEYIDTEFPELTKDVPVYNMEATIKFFQQRLNASEYEERDIDVQVDIDKDFESETEVGDFEKLSRQSSQKQKIDISTICVPETAAASTVTEDNMDTHKINMEKLQQFLINLYGFCRANVNYMKEELNRVRSEMDTLNKLVKDAYTQVLQAWLQHDEQFSIRFREHTQRLTVDHELELTDMKAALDAKDKLIDDLNGDKEKLVQEYRYEIERLQKENESTKELLEKTKEDMKQIEQKVEEAEAKRQKEIKDLQEKMQMEHKTEIESIRSRFRLVTLANVDRSPSETSLEKIERTDFIEISSHNAIVMQTKENAEVEKDEAVRLATEKVEAEWRAKYDEEINALKNKYENEKQVSINEVTRRLLSEKDRQLELSREREQQLARENHKYRDTIHQLADPDTNAYDSLLTTQIASLENEKAALQQQVSELKKELDLKRADDSERSKDEDSDGRSSPKREESRRVRSRCHTPFGLAAGTLSLAACQPGHTVLVLWDPAHLNYTIMQEASIMYFVHSDCLPALELSINVKNESERRLYAVATLDSKEYCYAKKSGNRYHMPRGSRFYRVRVRPARPALPAPPPCCDHRHKHDMQKSVDTSQSTSSNTDDAGKVCEVVEVATGALINLESPGEPPAAPAPSSSAAPAPGEDQLDSIETSDHWHNARMQVSTASNITEMECSVGRVGETAGEPLELAGSALSVVARGVLPPGSELAQEAEP